MQDFLNGLDLSSPIAGVNPATRVGATEAALDLLGELQRKHGDISIHHAGGPADGVEPVCLAQGTLRIGEDDTLLGDIDGVPVFVAGPGSEAWDGQQFILDVIKGQSAGFSLVGGLGKRFLTRARAFEAEDLEELGLSRD